jgi:hypothetical protein
MRKTGQLHFLQSLRHLRFACGLRPGGNGEQQVFTHRHVRKQ